jgi:putative ABC transport system permease protein
MLGIIIGVTAVIVIVGLGNGMENYMTEQFSEMGTNTLTVNIRGRGSSRSVSVDQMYALVADNPEYLDQLSPMVTMSATVKIGTETPDSTTVTGVSEAYFGMKGYTVARAGDWSTWTSPPASTFASSATTSTRRTTAATRWARPSRSTATR